MPNVSVKLPALTQKDKDDILFGIEQGFDFIAASFVRSAACVKEIKELLKEHGAGYIPVISKIENAEGIQNFDEIMYCSDGIMVARGDLGVEIPAEEVPYLQKMCIRDSAYAGGDGAHRGFESGYRAGAGRSTQRPGDRSIWPGVQR